MGTPTRRGHDNLPAALSREIERVVKMIPVYRSVPLGQFTDVMMQASLDRAKDAVAAADPVGMCRAYGGLKGYSL